jgi:hypothetical protein
MKKFSVLFIGSFLLATSLFAQTKCEKAVAAAAEKLRLAMISGNKADLENIVMDQLSYGHSGGHVDDKTEFVQKLAGGGSDFVTIDISEQTVHVVKKTGIVRHTLVAETNDNNKPATVHLKILLIFVKDDGKWKLLARQAVKQV